MIWLVESWRDCVKRYAKPYGLEQECLDCFDRAITDGTPEDEAAWEALYEWDVLDYDKESGHLVVTRMRTQKEEA